MSQINVGPGGYRDEGSGVGAVLAAILVLAIVAFLVWAFAFGGFARWSAAPATSNPNPTVNISPNVNVNPGTNPAPSTGGSSGSNPSGATGSVSGGASGSTSSGQSGSVTGSGTGSVQTKP
jgi:hypothetical protein